MHRFTLAVVIALLAVLPAAAQKDADVLQQAQAVLHSAEQAGARTFATSLYDEAAYRIRFAQENWSATKADPHEQARVNAIEGLWAARAALAKANWLGTNEAIRNLQSDVRRLGGTSDVRLADEPTNYALNRGSNSATRIAFAQAALDQAKAAGGAAIAPDDLESAQKNLDSARKVTKAGGNNDAADYLAYTSEMMARRAYYLARANEASKQVTPLQLTRTQLAQAQSERQAAIERQQREEAERQSADLQRQLAAEQSNRAAQQAEVDRLRNQIAETERQQQAHIDADRAAREAAEKALSDMYGRYETAIVSGTPNDVETLRRQLEDQQLALRAIEERERLNEQQMSAELEGLRGTVTSAQQAGVDAQLLAQRQAELQQRQGELEALRKEREADAQRLITLQQQHANAIAEAQMRRQQAEAQAQQLKAQAEAAQQAAQQAQQAAEQSRLQAEQSKQQAAATQAELDRTRQQLAERDADARRMRMEAELARLASTRSDKRGFVVALSGGLLFDTGKNTLKAGAKSTLTKIAAQLKTNPDAKVSVEGHTDSVGTDAKNQELSEKRAGAVRDFLVSAGLPADHVTSVGKGESEPIATNKTAAGRQQNRRVELVITQ
jgi:outer membrane protein OmpA-like peptidoglycan-associated protein